MNKQPSLVLKNTDADTSTNIGVGSGPGSEYFLKGTLRIEPPICSIILSDVINKSSFSEFEQLEDHIFKIDAGNVHRLSSVKTSKIINLFLNKNIIFTSLSQKLLETMSYIQFDTTILSVQEIVFETISGRNIRCDFNETFNLYDYEKIIGEETSMCPEIFDLFIKEYKLGVNNV